MRLNPDLIAAAEREARVQKRSVPKQIEFWAALGRAVQDVLDYSDVIAVMQGLKQISIETVASTAAEARQVFAELEGHRRSGALSQMVNGAGVYYEASQTHAGLIDRVSPDTGERCSGRFHNGTFMPIEP